MRSYFTLSAFALGLLALAGCAGNDSPAPPAATSSTSPAPKAAEKAEANPDNEPLTDEELAEIKKLPDEADQKAAIAQKTCPFTGEHLGSMGIPIKKVVDGKPVFLCCSGCTDKFDKDPQGALAKVSKK
jgi:hypothetical protein